MSEHDRIIGLTAILAGGLTDSDWQWLQSRLDRVYEHADGSPRVDGDPDTGYARTVRDLTDTLHDCHRSLAAHLRDMRLLDRDDSLADRVIDWICHTDPMLIARLPDDPLQSRLMWLAASVDQPDRVLARMTRLFDLPDTMVDRSRKAAGEARRLADRLASQTNRWLLQHHCREDLTLRMDGYGLADMRLSVTRSTTIHGLFMYEPDWRPRHLTIPVTYELTLGLDGMLGMPVRALARPSVDWPYRSGRDLWGERRGYATGEQLAGWILRFLRGWETIR